LGKTLVLTFIAEDRPGVIQTLSEVVTGQGGNWLESRMAHLAQKFAGIARIQIADEKVGPLEEALAALEPEGLRVAVEEGTPAAAASGPLYTLDLVGPDQPGIVHDISRCLAEHDASIEEMETRVDGAPMGGGALFYAQARVRVPPDLSEDELRQALEDLAGALMVDISLREDA
jgi:glycine cleavage system regulatory protein